MRMGMVDLLVARHAADADVRRWWFLGAARSVDAAEDRRVVRGDVLDASREGALGGGSFLGTGLPMEEQRAAVQGPVEGRDPGRLPGRAQEDLVGSDLHDVAAARRPVADADSDEVVVEPEAHAEAALRHIGTHVLGRVLT